MDHTRDEDIVKIAPAGCHQYFRNDTGDLISFNFNKDAPRASKYQPSLRYKICIKPPGNKCQIDFSIRRLDDFSLGRSSATSDERCQEAMCGMDCTNMPSTTTQRMEMDFISIPGGFTDATRMIETTSNMPIMMTRPM